VWCNASSCHPIRNWFFDKKYREKNWKKRKKIRSDKLHYDGKIYMMKMVINGGNQWLLT
jgi:hypothetical protein